MAEVKAGALVEGIKRVVGEDVLILFGDTGSMKTILALKLVQDALGGGQRAFYLDTEGNLPHHLAEALGGAYKYTPVWSEVEDIVKGLKDYDLFVMDSLGMIALGNWASMSVKGRGDARLKEINLLWRLKQWAYARHSLVVITTQPESEYAGGDDGPRGQGPVGGKGLFVGKEIWRPVVDKTEEHFTRAKIVAWRSREFGTGAHLLTVTRRDAEIAVESSDAFRAKYKEIMSLTAGKKAQAAPPPDNGGSRAPAPVAHIAPPLSSSPGNGGGASPAEIKDLRDLAGGLGMDSGPRYAMEALAQLSRDQFLQLRNETLEEVRIQAAEAVKSQAKAAPTEEAPPPAVPEYDPTVKAQLMAEGMTLPTAPSSAEPLTLNF